MRARLTALWQRPREISIQGWQWLKEALIQAWQWLKESSSRARQWLGAALDSSLAVVEGILKPGPAMAEGGTRAWQWLKEFSTRAWQWLKEFSTRAWQWLKEFSGRARQWLAEFFQQSLQHIRAFPTQAPHLARRLITRGPAFLKAAIVQSSQFFQAPRIATFRRRWLRRLMVRLFKLRSRISIQLYAGLAGGLIFTISASLVAWISFNQVGEVQQQVNEESIPEIAAAFDVARQSSTLVDAAPRLTTATPEDFPIISENITRHRDSFEALLTSLTAYTSQQQRVERIHSTGTELINNIESIGDSVATKFTLAEQSNALLDELKDLSKQIYDILIPAIDNQLFYAMTGYQELRKAPVPRHIHFSREEVSRYRYLANMEADITLSMQLLGSAFNLSDAALLEPLIERFEGTTASIQRSLSALGSKGPVARKAEPLFQRFFDLSQGPEGSFALRTRELALAREQQALLDRNRALAVELISEVDGLVIGAKANANAATMKSAEAIAGGRGLLLALNIAGLIGTALIAWLFVGRVLLRRLEYLAGRMVNMAEGDLEGKVLVQGRDEIAKMASALEGFRRNALEVQRLNLVEKLAGELETKNEQLESAMENLQLAQGQIVAQEKLAALGEVTAGVAHEIRNPLNFINNFSTASVELMDELKDFLPKKGEVLTREALEDIAETSGMLTENMVRIRTHGERANRIVSDMLSMGSDTIKREVVDINQLVDEFAGLVTKSSDFRMDKKQELDPDVGSLVVFKRDLGRVILNLVTNACYAAEQKQKAIKGDYEPTLWISTHRLEETVEIRVKDNGMGIPPDLVDKIFNPFFTTKPTDEGTGLGLSLSNDIILGHGGTIEVNTEEGNFTEMIVTLPLVSNQQEAEESSQAATGSDKSDEPDESK